MWLLYSPWFIPILISGAIWLSLRLNERWMETVDPASIRPTDAAHKRAVAVTFFGAFLYVLFGLSYELMSGLALFMTTFGMFIVWLCLHAKTARQNSEDDTELAENVEKTVLDDLVKGGDTMKTMPFDRLHEMHMNIHEELKRRMGSQAS
jgi:Flp pilus assembly protein TadB